MKSSTDDRRRRADRVFEAALDLTPEQRGRYLDDACAGDPELRALVERLLRSADDETLGFGPGGALPSSLWSEVVGELIGEAGGDPEGGDTSGKVIGRYRILEEIGRGGMAVVYLAERADGQFEQKVALKRIKRGVDTDEVLLRFDQERQILALARHPHIAQLLDGGVDDDGRPYFVMEHVEGRPIDRYCDEETLDVPDRLRLFLQVARAVSYAHRNLVVHRDLKPSNILVTDDGRDSEGSVVKLLDFGIAKLLDADAAPGATPMTRTWARPMTPVYASPEQIRGGPVTTASDIYQLGLLLYELLSGCYPYRLAERSPDEAVRAICETEPTRPSNAVLAAAGHAPPAAGDEAPTSEAIGAARRTSPERLRRRLAGDLDNIVLMALRKEPERRYGSVTQLIEDIERHLDGRPVRARPNTFAYRTGKLLRRHRVAAVTAAAALALIVTLVAFYTVRLTHERDRARLAAAEANQVARFLRGLFEVSAPTRSLGEQVTARQLLDRGAERIDEDLAEQPKLQASMMTLMGDVYRELALLDEAGPLIERAVALRRADPDTPPESLAESLRVLAELKSSGGEYDEARSLVEEALSLHRRVLGDRHPEVGRTLMLLGRVVHVQGELDEALEIQRQAREVLGATLGPEHPDVGFSLLSTGKTLVSLQRFREAEEVLRDAVEILRAAGESEQIHLAEARQLLGTALRHRGDPEGAVEQLRESLRITEKVYGPDHPQVAMNLDLLAGALHHAERFEQAIEYRQRAIGIYERTYGPDHPQLAGVLNNLGRTYQRIQDYDRALELYGKSARILEASLGPDHLHTLISLRNVASLLYQTGDLQAARELFERVRDGYEREVGPDTPYLALPLHRLGTIHLDLGQPAEAEPLLRRALAVGRDEGTARFPEIVRPRIDLGRCLTRLGRYDEAEQVLMRNLDEGDLDYGSAKRTHQALAELYEVWDRPDDAARHLRTAADLDAAAGAG